MARRVVEILEDDIDGGDAVETVQFGLDGANYEIDLNEDNAAALREAFSGYVGNARKVRTRAKASTSAGRSIDSKLIRAWALEAGYEVSARGRIPASVVEAYYAANG